jgi:hypothetical protein
VTQKKDTSKRSKNDKQEVSHDDEKKSIVSEPDVKVSAADIHELFGTYVQLDTMMIFYKLFIANNYFSDVC